MTDLVIFFIVAIVVFCIGILVAYKYLKDLNKQFENFTGVLADFRTTSSIDLNPIMVQLSSEFKQLNKTIDVLEKSQKKLPIDTLRTIQGSLNTTTGKLGEMIQLIALQQQYDRLEIQGGIVDFIGIKFPKDESDLGAIDFIDVKTGRRAVLSAEQKQLRSMIKDTPECIGFKTVKVDIT